MKKVLKNKSTVVKKYLDRSLPLDERLLSEDAKSEEFSKKYFEILNRNFFVFYAHPIDALKFFTTKKIKLTNNLSGFINSFTSSIVVILIFISFIFLYLY